jgi:2'-5' RNA ligase
MLTDLMRAFLAIEVPEEIRNRLYEAAKEFKNEDTSIVHEDGMHITLKFFGEIDNSEMVMIEDAMDRVDMRRFRIEIRGIGIFNPDFLKVAYAIVSEGESEIKALKKKIDNALNDAGIGTRDEHEFSAHVTLARFKRKPNGNRILSILDKYKNASFGSFEISKFALKKSTLTKEGSVYETLRDFNLM